jgi:hypothetical protein
MFSGGTFASLRLGENRRLNKKTNFSPRRKDAKAAKAPLLLWSHLILKDHQVVRDINYGRTDKSLSRQGLI